MVPSMASPITLLPQRCPRIDADMMPWENHSPPILRSLLVPPTDAHSLHGTQRCRGKTGTWLTSLPQQLCPKNRQQAGFNPEELPIA